MRKRTPPIPRHHHVKARFRLPRSSVRICGQRCTPRAHPRQYKCLRASGWASSSASAPTHSAAGENFVGILGLSMRDKRCASLCFLASKLFRRNTGRRSSASPASRGVAAVPGAGAWPLVGGCSSVLVRGDDGDGPAPSSTFRASVPPLSAPPEGMCREASGADLERASVPCFGADSRGAARLRRMACFRRCNVVSRSRSTSYLGASAAATSDGGFGRNFS